MKPFVALVILILTIRQVRSDDNNSTNALQRLLENLQGNIDWHNDSNIASLYINPSLVPDVLSLINDLIVRTTVLSQQIDILLPRPLNLGNALKDLQVSVKLFLSTLQWAANTIDTAWNNIYSKFFDFYTAYETSVKNWSQEQNKILLNCTEEIQTKVRPLIEVYGNESLQDAPKCIEDSLVNFDGLLYNTAAITENYIQVVYVFSGKLAICINLLSNGSQNVMECKAVIQKAINDLQSVADVYKTFGGNIGGLATSSKTADYCYILVARVFQIESKITAGLMDDLNEEMCSTKGVKPQNNNF